MPVVKIINLGNGMLEKHFRAVLSIESDRLEFESPHCQHLIRLAMLNPVTERKADSSSQQLRMLALKLPAGLQSRSTSARTEAISIVR